MKKSNFIIEKLFSSLNLNDLYDSKHYIVTEIPNINKYRVVIDGHIHKINNEVIDNNIKILIEDDTLRIYVND